jgi:hypothetical protein
MRCPFRIDREINFEQCRDALKKYDCLLAIAKPANIALILTARDMDKAERSRYERK